MRNISPSIIAGDFSKLDREIKEIEDLGITRLHLDIMDGNFVPNLTFGPLLVEGIRKLTKMHLECHLMINNPKKYLNDYISAGGDTVIVHIENNPEFEENLSEIKRQGVKGGIAFNPDTPIKNILPFVNKMDYVLIMSVFPGFCGQTFIESTIDSMSEFVNQKKKNSSLVVAVDGGVNIQTIQQVYDTGVDVSIVGSGLLGAKDRKKRYQELMNA
ncbi:MAG: ribulose-phosphate 3-epimerase [Candidatus Marinimicrobia bacterium]|nr:ribulose-phosphate 3-epimerase [Candidatus Neomarinimicrobiota bacterium]|tara:strand:+ start:782 stop:1426 length:645 start_codon:yes stop_codon:yes gene_type:complete